MILLACTGSELEPTIIQAPATQIPATPEPTLAPASPTPPCSDEQNAVAVALPSAVTVSHAAGSGSGVIVGDDKILTAFHVIVGRVSATVTLSDGTTLDAVVRGGDPDADIAILDVSPLQPLPAIEWAALEPALASRVVAIGYPLPDFFGEVTEPAATTGLVSRRFSEGGIDYLQTDAAINAGSSGGPLVDLCGRLVGINVAKIVDVGAEGIGVAVSVNTARPLVNRIIQAPPSPRAGLLPDPSASESPSLLGPIPILLRVDAPETAAFGDVITVHMVAVNAGSSANGGSISVGLPDNPEVIVSSTNPVPPTNSRQVGESVLVFEGCRTSVQPSRYPLVEGYWAQWPSLVEHEISFQLRVPAVRVLRLEVRVTMGEFGSTCVRNDPPPYLTPDEDQQNLPIAVVYIFVVR